MGDLQEVGAAALAQGDWAAAREAYEAAWLQRNDADSLNGLGRALWWLDDPARALDLRSRAFALLRRDRRHLEAGDLAVWLARQYRSLYARDDIAEGWLARARSLVAELGETGSLESWLRLAECEATGQGDPGDLDDIVDAGRALADVDLEIVALARRGALKVSIGDVAGGRTDLNEAMVAALSGEGNDVQYVGEAVCTLLEVAGWMGDPGMTEPWAEQIMHFQSSYAFGPLVPFSSGSATDLLSAFCKGCCGGVYLVTGRIDEAEAQLLRAASRLTGEGLRTRCLHPIAELVEIRVAQGRLEEAEAMLADFAGDLACATAAASLYLARGDAVQSVAVLTKALDDPRSALIPALPIQAALVEAALAAGDPALARSTCDALTDTARVTGSRLHAAQAAMARGRISLAEGSSDATAELRSAALGFAESGAALPAARSRVLLARSLGIEDRGLAVTEARSALLAFERLGATAEANRTAAFLRTLGDTGRSKPRDVGVLSKREAEVLRLVAEGLSNAEIAERLVISVKTAGHHVSSILTKLGLRSRTEAAAFALLRLPR